MTQLLWGNQTIDQYKNLDPPEYRARVNQLKWRTVYQGIPASDFQRDDILASLPSNYNPTDNFPIKDFNMTFNFDAQKMRTHIWFYYRLMEQVDSEIGTVLDALEKSSFKDNTLIIFTSDHGDMAGSHNLTGKNLPYEECQRVPLIIAGNGIQKNVVDITTPVSTGWDILPTILDLMQIDVPSELHGISLRNKITKNEEIDRKYLYYETKNSYGVIEDGKFKYSRFITRKPFTVYPPENESLFDLETDPGELFNLINSSEYTSKLSRLRAALAVEMGLRNIAIGD